MEPLNGDQDDPEHDAHEGNGLQFEEDEDWKLEEEYQDELQDCLQQTSVYQLNFFQCSLDVEARCDSCDWFMNAYGLWFLCVPQFAQLYQEEFEELQHLAQEKEPGSNGRISVTFDFSTYCLILDDTCAAGELDAK